MSVILKRDGKIRLYCKGVNYSRDRFVPSMNDPSFRGRHCDIRATPLRTGGGQGQNAGSFGREFHIHVLYKVSQMDTIYGYGFLYLLRASSYLTLILNAL